MTPIDCDSHNKFKVIYADPPWSYEQKHTGGGYKSGASDKYTTMSLDDIKAMDIKGIAHKDSVLFLWATVPLLPEAIQVMESWGFKYKTSIFWRKIMSLGMGYWFRGQVEVCLFGTRGKVKAFRCQVPNFIQTKVRKHSQKPDEMYGLIERIAREHHLNPKIELFARERRQGWVSFGNQLPMDTQMLLSPSDNQQSKHI